MAGTDQSCTHTLDDKMETVVNRVKVGWNRSVVHSQPVAQDRNHSKQGEGWLEWVSYALTYWMRRQIQG